MRAFNAALALVLPALLLSAACGKSAAEDCTAALTATKSSIAALCQQQPYAASQFCHVCVANGFYSVDDSCVCQDLTFNTDNCYYAGDAGAEPFIHNALDYAVSVCSNRSAQLPYSCAELDATPAESGPCPMPVPTNPNNPPVAADGGMESGAADVAVDAPGG